MNRIFLCRFYLEDANVFHSNLFVYTTVEPFFVNPENCSNRKFWYAYPFFLLEDPRINFWYPHFLKKQITDDKRRLSPSSWGTILVNIEMRKWTGTANEQEVWANTRQISMLLKINTMEISFSPQNVTFICSVTRSTNFTD